MLDNAPQMKDDEGTKELASKRHSMWIAELLDDSRSDPVASDMSAFEEETMGDLILPVLCISSQTCWIHKGSYHSGRTKANERKISFGKFST
jgi:hypothetical protein